MGYDVEKSKKETMSVCLAKGAIKDLATNLGLSNSQIVRAKATALALSTDEKLKNCSAESIIKYCFEIARYNFQRDDDAYPIPFWDKTSNKTHIQTQLSYKGFRELALRSNAYRDINCSEVYACDKVTRDRETGKFKIEFETDYTKSIGSKLIGFYAYAIDKNGEVSNSLFWTKEQCEKHGHVYSKSYNQLWGKEETFNKMAKKTVIKQLCAELKTTPELEMAIKQDQAVHTSIKENDEYLDNACNNTINNNDTEVRTKANVIDLEKTEVKVEEKPKIDPKTTNDLLNSLSPKTTAVKHEEENDSDDGEITLLK